MAVIATQKERKTFRKLIRRLFELGAPRVVLGAKAGELAVVAEFGEHQVLLGAFEGEEIDDVLRLAMQARATSAGGLKSAALGEAFAALGAS